MPKIPPDDFEAPKEFYEYFREFRRDESGARTRLYEWSWTTGEGDSQQGWWEIAEITLSQCKGGFTYRVSVWEMDEPPEHGAIFATEIEAARAAWYLFQSPEYERQETQRSMTNKRPYGKFAEAMAADPTISPHGYSMSCYYSPKERRKRAERDRLRASD